MAALSMTCGICHIQLRSVQEAQEHAELTGHADFSESTEPVLNLLCKTCGKPCRTKTECDLHTKRTGHGDYDDKTAEAAKPISLSTKPEEGASSSAPAEASSDSSDLVIPEVDKQLLEEMEGMGFPHVRAIRALHFSGSSSIEAAINWIVEHESDPDIDEMSMVAAASQHTLTPEEAKSKMFELRERARKKKEEEEKRTEKEREKERIRIGKELLEAKRTEEDNERKRLILLRKAEKEEEQRAREKIRQKLEEDKAERRRKMGLPPEDPSKVPAPPPVVEDKKSHLPVRPATKAEQMRECLRNLKQSHKDDEARVKTAFQTLLTYIGNVARSPDDEKFRKIRLSNSSFQERVGSLKGGIRFLEICGFEKEHEEFLILPRNKVDLAILNTAGAELNSAIVNPYFGVL